MSNLVTTRQHHEADLSIGPSSSALERIARRIFALVLKLYPRHFHETFADEMLEIFTLAAGEASQDGIIPVVKYLLRELAELPIALLLEHLYQRRKQSMGLLQFNSLDEMRVARWVARCTSLLIGGFVLLVFLFNEDVRQDPTPPTLILGALSLLVLVAWRWERVGGSLTLLALPIFFVSVIIQMTGRDGWIAPSWLLILIDAAITLSFLIVGWLFVSVAKHSEVAQERGAKQHVPATPRKRSWAYVVIGLLGLLAIILFIIPMVAGVQQRIEMPAVEFDTINSEYLISSLLSAGAVVGIGSATVAQPFLSVPGYELVVDGEIVQAFEYADTASATAAAVSLDSEKSSIWKEANWNGTPYSYQVYSVILLYAGNNENTVTKMEAAFGPPFAGR
jgi:hypothetical protein